MDSALARLETDPGFSGGYGQPVVRGYRKVMGAIRAATDVRDLHAMRSLRFEKLAGQRKHQHSLRINQQWRLIVELTRAHDSAVILVVEIVDYH